MRKGFVLAASFAIAMASAATVNADPILFDPDGAGPAGSSQITLLDLAPGNSITQGVTAFTPAGTPANILFQANMSVAKNGDNIVAANCLTSASAAIMDCFKFVAGLPGIVSEEVPPPSLEFRFNPTSPVNFFNIYANNVPGSDLNGTNFTTGSLILTGTWLNDPSFFATFVPNLQSGGPLDQFGANDYPGVNSVAGTGAFSGNLVVTFADSTYFPSLATGTTLFVASSKETLPYTQTNPTACFSATGAPGTDCTSPGVSSVGAVNGISGPNTMLETDASFSFITPSVPEPATMALFGLVLLGGGATLRRRQMRR